MIQVLILALSGSNAFAQSLGPYAPTSLSGSTPGQIQAQFQQAVNPAAQSSPDAFNPLSVLNEAGRLIQGGSSLGSRLNSGSIQPNQTSVQTGGQNAEGGISVMLNIMLLLTVIALVPSIMLMTTSFVRIMVVLALLRQAMGTQSLPPAQVVTGLALFMTALVMKPTVDRIWTDAVVPYQNGEIREIDVLWERASNPMRDFMFDQIEATNNWSSLYMILNYQGIDTSAPEKITRADISTTSLIPAYMLSELKVSFLMGFRVYLPFLVIDMVIASLLISMSMMMLPPVMISLPFKLMLFVMVDGWSLIVGSLLESFVQEGASPRSSALSASLVLCVPMLLIRRIVHPPTDELLRDRARSEPPCRPPEITHAL
ncbi:MAG: flagellar type III secretion system pore protein FliP [Phycisphaerales bacterium]